MGGADRTRVRLGASFLSSRFRRIYAVGIREVPIGYMPFNDIGFRPVYSLGKLRSCADELSRLKIIRKKQPSGKYQSDFHEIGSDLNDRSNYALLVLNIFSCERLDARGNTADNIFLVGLPCFHRIQRG